MNYMSSSESSSLRMTLVIHNGEKIVIIIINAHSFRWITHLTTTVNSIYIIRIEWSKTLWGSCVWKHFHILCFLFVGNRLQPPWSSLSLKGQNLEAGALGWPREMVQGGRWEGGFRMRNTCTPVVDSCWCTTKPIQYCKVISLQLK